MSIESKQAIVYFTTTDHQMPDFGVMQPLAHMVRGDQFTRENLQFFFHDIEARDITQAEAVRLLVEGGTVSEQVARHILNCYASYERNKFTIRSFLDVVNALDDNNIATAFLSYATPLTPETLRYHGFNSVFLSKHWSLYNNSMDLNTLGISLQKGMDRILQDKDKLSQDAIMHELGTKIFDCVIQPIITGLNVFETEPIFHTVAKLIEDHIAYNANHGKKVKVCTELPVAVCEGIDIEESSAEALRDQVAYAVNTVYNTALKPIFDRLENEKRGLIKAALLDMLLEDKC